MINFSLMDLSFIKEGDEFIYCNLVQNRIHGDEIGLWGMPVLLPIINCTACNIINTWPAPGSNIVGGNRGQRDVCYHVAFREDGGAYRGLPIEDENCIHVVETDTITIDGNVITNYQRKHKKLGIWQDVPWNYQLVEDFLNN